MSPTLVKPVPALKSIAVPAARAVNPTAVLAIILATYLMIVLDVSVVIAALPKIETTLDFSPTTLSWVQNAYTLTFGGLLLLGARAGDILGRRRMLVTGVGLFTIASFAGGLAPSAAWLLAARAVQGVGAAIAAPSTLALLTTTFREGHARTRAIAYYSAVAGGGGSVGLVLGGMLTDWLSWRWGLFINVPVGLAVILLAPRYLPETERRSGRFDFTGAVTSTLGMTAGPAEGLAERRLGRLDGSGHARVVRRGVHAAGGVLPHREARRAADHAAASVRRPPAPVRTSPGSSSPAACSRRSSSSPSSCRESRA